MEALIFDIYKGTVHDGPGLRSTVFFKGCPLHCKWCHNPEGISPDNAVWWDSGKCIGCGTCENSCIIHACTLTSDGVKINRELCTHCYTCTAACPSGALTTIATKWEVSDLAKELIKYKLYFDQTNGGVTVSGGEALMQQEAVFELFRLLKAAGIHTALDTCGFAPLQNLIKLYPVTDCFLFDIKIFNGEVHKYWTGVDNTLIIDNFTWLVDQVLQDEKKKTIWVRTPLIPGATTSIDNIHDIGCFLNSFPGGVIERWELCSFNNACSKKYEKLNLEWSFSDAALLTDSEIHDLKEVAHTSGFPESRILISGIYSS